MAKSGLNSSSLLVCLLGTPRIEGLEGVLTGAVSHRHRLALLALLVSAPKHLLSREKLIGLLWPENDAQTSRQLLNVSVHAIRKALGDRVILSEGDALHFDPGAIRVDVLEFEAALDRADASRAVDLYGGPFVEGLVLPDALEFEYWIDHERDRLQRRYYDALERLAEAAMATGDFQQAVARWRQRLVGTPADAHVVVRLMLALEQAGDRAGALQTADVHCALLQDEFQAGPDPQVVELAAHLRSNRAPVARAHLPRVGDNAVAPTTPAQSDSVAVHGISRWRQLRLQPRARTLAVSAVAAVSLALVLLAAGFSARQRARLERVRTVLLPQAAQLIDQGRSFPALRVLREAERIAPDYPLLHDMLMETTMLVDVQTDPPGARVHVRDIFDPKDQWENVGITPLEDVRLPPGRLIWRVELKGYESREQIRMAPRGLVKFSLYPDQNAPAGMVHIDAGRINLSNQGAFTLSDFWIDRLEVTNREFKRFVDQGGYNREELWKEFLTEGGLSWNSAQQLFRDSTDTAGPANWRAGNYANGQDDHPVGGVSWYEAAAYCAFVHKQLPTAYHWTQAADLGPMLQFARFGNFGTKASMPVGRDRTIGAFGTYDMAGNVKEWTWNRGGENQRYILGGGWNEPDYMFVEHDARLPLEREAVNGIRCAKYSQPLSAQATAAVPRRKRDVQRERPVDDALFATYRSLYDYDKLPLNARVESIDTSAVQWRREQVSFDAAYGNERVPALLFLPKDSTPRYQTVVYFPGASAFFGKFPFDDVGGQLQWILFLVRSGRAVVVPIYKGTFTRFEDVGPPQSNRRRDFVIAAAKDLRRTLDYLETRADIDMDKLAYYGLSNGHAVGAVITAVEPRFSASILVGGGLTPRPFLPEVEPFNFLPRVKVPTLLINGRYDFFFPHKESQLPFFDALGTPLPDKYHEVVPSGHVPVEFDLVSKPALAWLDRYLGPVDRAPASHLPSPFDIRNR